MSIYISNEHRLTIIFQGRRFEIVATEQQDGQWITEVAESDRGRKKHDRRPRQPFQLAPQPHPLIPMMAAVHGVITAIDSSLIEPLEEEEI